MAWYRAGTVSVTNGSASVTGSGTAFVANVSIGEGIVLPDGRIYEITNVSSDTSLTLATNYLGSTASSQPYAIAPLRGRIAQLLSETSSLIASFAGVRDGIGAGLFPDGTVTAPSFRFSSSQTTGIFRPGANRLAVSTNGVQRFEVDASGNALFTQTLQAPLGALATPSYTFTGDLNTGMWSPAADTLAFSTNGGERLRIDSSGNVGIGTSSPAYKLDVQYSNTNFGTGLYVTNTATTGSAWARMDVKTANAIGSVLLAQDQSGEGVLQNAGNYGLRFGTNNTERMRIDSSGNLLVGTTSGSYKLDVTAGGPTAVFGSASGSGLSAYTAWRRDGTILGYVGNGTGVLAGSGATDFAMGATGARNLCFGTNDTERMRIDASGNLLVGTTSALYSTAGRGLVEVNGSSSALIALKVGNNSFGYFNATSTAMEIIVPAANPLVFGTNDTGRMWITATGNVGINESTPDYKLDVNGTFGFTPGASVTPVDNGDVVFELTNNTTLTIKAKGSDGVVRSGTITLA